MEYKKNINKNVKVKTPESKFYRILEYFQRKNIYYINYMAYDFI